MIEVIPERSTTLPSVRHLYMLVVAGLLEVAARLSPRARAGLVRAISAIAYALSWEKRRMAEHSVARVLGPLSRAERTRIVRGMFLTFWDELFALAGWQAGAIPEMEITGLQHLEAALAAGHGAILWESAFFGRRNVSKQVLRRRGFRLHQVHHEMHRAGFAGDSRSGWLRDRVVLPYYAARERAMYTDVVTLPLTTSLAFTRQLLSVLQRNQIVSVTADVANGERLLTLSLLGEPKRFPPGMVSLARTSGAPLLPLFCTREPDGRLHMTIEPAIPIATTDDRESDLAAPLRAYATLLEGYLRRHPDQYRNWHYPWWNWR